MPARYLAVARSSLGDNGGRDDGAMTPCISAVSLCYAGPHMRLTAVCGATTEGAMRPMTRFSMFVLVGILCAVPAAAQFQSVGSLEFRTSTKSAEAQQHFLRGVAILHSFGWKQAIEQFQAAQELDPDFVLAYWGETLCYNHPLFGGPTPDEDNPRTVLARLGSSREERLEKAPTDREKGFLTAVETLWAREGTYDERRVAYMEAMADLHERYPDDHEVATFYSVATLSAARALGDQSGRLEVRAGTIALSVFSQNPEHPGAAHYTIHSFDDPIHAPLALPSAMKYAEDRPGGGSRETHADTHLHSARHVGARLDTQPAVLRCRTRPLATRRQCRRLRTSPWLGPVWRPPAG